MRGNDFAKALLPLALLALAAPPAEAGTVRRMGLSELAEHCDVAVEGRVIEVSARRVGPRWIETWCTLEVERTFVGEPCALLTVRLPGGTLADGSGMVVPGLPRLAVGEEVVLFLSEESARGTRMPVGLAQGRLRVVREPGVGKRLVGDATAGLRIVGPPGTALTARGIDYAAALAEIESGIAARAERRR